MDTNLVVQPKRLDVCICSGLNMKLGKTKVEASSGTDVQTLGAQHVLILSYKVHVWFSMLCPHQEGGRVLDHNWFLIGKRMSSSASHRRISVAMCYCMCGVVG